MIRVDVVGRGKKGTKEEITILRECVKPYTKDQIEALEKNTFHSPNNLKYNGMHFEVLFEHFDGESREAFGNEYSVAWIDENGHICSDRYFDVKFENGDILTAELEEINNFYYNTDQAN